MSDLTARLQAIVDRLCLELEGQSEFAANGPSGFAADEDEAALQLFYSVEAAAWAIEDVADAAADEDDEEALDSWAHEFNMVLIDVKDELDGTTLKRLTELVNDVRAAIAKQPRLRTSGQG